MGVKDVGYMSHGVVKCRRCNRTIMRSGRGWVHFGLAKADHKAKPR